MPRLPVDGTRVKELRVTLGSYERQQLERFIDGMQIRNIGQGFGAATDPIEAMFNTTLGTVGGAAIVAWAMKRFFGLDIPLDDKDDLIEMWAALIGAIGLTPEQRQDLKERQDAVKKEFADEAAIFPVRLLGVAQRIEAAITDFLFGKADSYANAPDLYTQPTVYPDVEIDPGLELTPEEYRAAVAARYVDGTYPFPYARHLLIQNGMSAIAASTYLNEAMGN